MRQPPSGKGRAWVVLSHPTQYLTACCCQLDLFPLTDLTQRLRNPVWPPRVESVQPTLLVWDSADITETGRAYQEATGLPRAQQGWGLTGCPPQSLRCHSDLSFPPGIVPSKTSLQIPTLRLLGAGSRDLPIHAELPAVTLPSQEQYGNYRGFPHPTPVLSSGG